MKISLRKLITVTFLTFFIFNTSATYAKENSMTPTEEKQFIKDAFANVFENMNATKEEYSKYFSKNYVQYVDGKKLNYTDFVEHVQALKSEMKSIKINFKYMVAEGDKVSTVHIANGVKKDGGIVETQFNALFEIKDHKIVLCNELSHLIKGSESDKDLGSRK